MSLSLKGQKATAIRENALKLYSEEFVPKLTAIRARQFRLKQKKKRLNLGYFVILITPVNREFIRIQTETSNEYKTYQLFAIIGKPTILQTNWVIYKSCDKIDFFADETKIEINRFPLYHFREKTSKPSRVGIREKSSIKVNVWAAISCKGPTRFCLFTSNLNQYGYKYILESNLLSCLETKFSQEELAANNNSKLSSNLCTHDLSADKISNQHISDFDSKLPAFGNVCFMKG
ncbi:hypothetical protein BpHYR1_016153 [Brachionus plicatilis]|uniref:Uncharacterized protein n=1 Tax=Brachionus plicatilis TaxID=10195 RepID=A0A3M7RPT1_BRAPC|nr:hypothetical protein BpHYR1_016153 [Brachionus plicatilis]